MSTEEHWCGPKPCYECVDCGNECESEEKTMTQDIRDLIAESREAAVRSALWDIPDLLFRLVDALEASLGVPPTCSDHRLVQHRDGKPPWCRACDGGDDE